MQLSNMFIKSRYYVIMTYTTFAKQTVGSVYIVEFRLEYCSELNI